MPAPQHLRRVVLPTAPRARRPQSTPLPLRVVATRGEVPNQIGPAITTAAQLRKIFRTRHYTGGQPVSELRLAFGN